ncbi:MAG: hypothetical protein GWO44_15300, partial [Thermoplasmata archaeon]|nr:hypothetical protein [Thermoplasmata archaeon]NIY04573.1 hypothetical protein [Thermoplasmata archaeon]
MEVIEDSIGRIREDSYRNLGERAASRGLVGSSVEFDQLEELEEELNRQARADA